MVGENESIARLVDAPRVALTGARRRTRPESRSGIRLLGWCLLPLYLLPAIAFFIGCVVICHAAHIVLRAVGLADPPRK